MVGFIDLAEEKHVHGQKTGLTIVKIKNDTRRIRNKEYPIVNDEVEIEVEVEGLEVTFPPIGG